MPVIPAPATANPIGNLTVQSLASPEVTTSENNPIRSPIVAPTPQQNHESSNVPLVPNFQSNAADADIVRFFIHSFFVHTNTTHF